MKLSTEGQNLIKEFEGFRSKAYLCPAGVWTIGWGSTRGFDGEKISPGQRVTKDKAHALFYRDKREKEQAVLRHVKVPLTQGQFDALVSFVYNFGETNFRKSTLLRELNKGNYMAAAAEFSRWNKARVNGRLTVMNGLVRRRAREQELFRNG